MVIAGVCGGPVCVGSDLYRHQAVGSGAVAELAVAVIAPAPERTAGLHCCGVRGSGICPAPVGIRAYLRQGQPVRQVTESELAVAVGTAGPQSPVRLPGNGVVVAGACIDPGGACADLGGKQAYLPWYRRRAGRTR